MPAAGEALDDRRFHGGFGGDGAAGEEDDAEGLLDKLKGGEYADVVATATASQQAQMCVGPGGTISKQDPRTAFAISKDDPRVLQQQPEDRDAELKRLRQARMKQMQEEEVWRQQGHGSLRELADEREFIEAIKPHERALVLLDDDSAGVQEEVRQVLEQLSRRHLEAQFCRLRVDRATFLTHMIELRGLPTLLLLRHGEVVRHLSPENLFEYASASSPLFRGHLSRTLLRLGALLEEGGGSSDEGEESYDDIRRNQRRNKDL